MSATDDVARMLTLVPWLLERPGASVVEIAEAFAVPEHRVRADLGHLDFCGLPGLGGGDLFEVSIVGDRVVLRMADELKRPLRPTATEALRLVLTVDSVAQALGDDVPALRSAVGKIRDVLGIPANIADVVGEPAPSTLSTCRRATVERRRVRLAYQGRTDDAPAERVVDPWALHVIDGVWYLQGHDVRARGRRVFHLGRIAEIELLDEPSTSPAPDSLEAPRYVPSPDDVDVVLHLDAGGRWLLDAVTVDEVVEEDGGGALVRLSTDAPQWLARLVLMAAGSAQVREPPEVARMVADLAGAALAGYAD